MADGNGNGARRVEYVQGTALLLCLGGIIAATICSFFTWPYYEKAVDIGLTSLISIATGILFGRATAQMPVAPSPPAPPEPKP